MAAVAGPDLQCTFNLYKSTEQAPYFVKDKGVTHVGHVTIDCCRDDFKTVNERRVHCAFKFGVTEIEVTVTNALKQTATSKLSFNI